MVVVPPAQEAVKEHQRVPARVVQQHVARCVEALATILVAVHVIRHAQELVDLLIRELAVQEHVTARVRQHAPRVASHIVIQRVKMLDVHIHKSPV